MRLRDVRGGAASSRQRRGAPVPPNWGALRAEASHLGGHMADQNLQILARRLADGVIVAWLLFTLVSIARNSGWF